MKLRPFQTATADAACAALTSEKGTRRFLIADEVGLGKTVVAREVIRRLSRDGHKKLTVYYVTRGQRVASQNRNRLVDFLDDGAKAAALSKADRLGLIPLEDRSRSRLRLYALSPDTSFPGGKSRLHAGRRDERSFLEALLRTLLPRLVESFPEALMRQRVKNGWEASVDSARKRVREKRGAVDGFRRALQMEFQARGTDLRDALKRAAQAEKPTRFIGRLRRALSHSALLSNPPDLVILDEFQRYREMLTAEGQSDPLITSLFAGRTGREAPKVLLLSATPYRLYASHWEENIGTEAHRELFDVIEFLGGSRLRAEATRSFAEFGEALHALASAADADAKLLGRTADRAQEISNLLSSIISRTERQSAGINDSSRTSSLPTTLQPVDIALYRHLAGGFQKGRSAEALAYWISVPLPAQALGPSYQAWRNAQFRRAPSAKLSQANRRKREADWAHPKLRALQSVLPAERLALPWAPPTLPWWPLAGAWSDMSTVQAGPKMLLFSRFRATPQSVAGLASLSAEVAAGVLAAKSFEEAWRPRRLQAKKGAESLLALFHPSPFLSRLFDPLEFVGATPTRLRAHARQRISAALRKLGIQIAKPSLRRHRPGWSALAAIEARYAKRLAGSGDQTAAEFDALHMAWSELGKKEASLARLRARWQAAPPLSWISRRELADLAELALAGPGNIVVRALRRHDARFGSDARSLVGLTWGALRRYLDNPVFQEPLRRLKPAEAIRRMMIDGCLESVLDEHFWVRRQSVPADSLAEDLSAALGLGVGSFSFRGCPAKDHRIRVRCHAALPFGGTDDLPTFGDGIENRAARPDEMRGAFNTPFWPHLLASTSVGQEGLDFHTWCDQVAHWDLCSTPVDLEQREGRIERFAGLSIRRGLVRSLGGRTLKESAKTGSSPWMVLSGLADEQLCDESGLSPWWVLSGAGVVRYIFKLPQGRDALRLARLHEQRLLYRLALGQPNPEDLLEKLAARADRLRSLRLELSAFVRAKQEEPTPAC